MFSIIKLYGSSHEQNPECVNVVYNGIGGDNFSSENKPTWYQIQIAKNNKSFKLILQDNDTAKKPTSCYLLDCLYHMQENGGEYGQKFISYMLMKLSQTCCINQNQHKYVCRLKDHALCIREDKPTNGQCSTVEILPFIGDSGFLSDCNNGNEQFDPNTNNINALTADLRKYCYNNTNSPGINHQMVQDMYSFCTFIITNTKNSDLTNPYIQTALINAHGYLISHLMMNEKLSTNQPNETQQAQIQTLYTEINNKYQECITSIKNNRYDDDSNEFDQHIAKCMLQLKDLNAESKDTNYIMIAFASIVGILSSTMIFTRKSNNRPIARKSSGRTIRIPQRSVK